MHVCGWDGLNLLHGISNTSPNFTIYTHASGLWAYFTTHWLQWQSEWLLISILAKELVLIVLSCAVWGPQLAGHAVLFRCNDSSVVISIIKGTAKESNVMHFLRYLGIFYGIL